MTADELTVLAAAIAADADLSAFPETLDGAHEMAALLDMTAAPDFTVWRSSVSISEVGAALDGAEVEGLTTAQANRIMVGGIYSGEGVDASIAGRRMFFDGLFSTAEGAVTGPALAMVWRRLATRGEVAFAVGAGTDADPATLGYEGNISAADISAARSI